MAEAAAPAPPPAPAVAPPTPPATGGGDWTSGFNDNLKGMIQNKGFKGPADLAESYYNFEKLQGVPQDRLLKLPENMNTPEGRAIMERLGTPKDAKGYSLDKFVPKEGGDPKLAEWAGEVFNKGNLTTAQAEIVMQAWNERQTASVTAHQENLKASILQADANLKKEWGMAYEQNLNLAKSGMAALELDAKTVDALEAIQGREKLFKTLQKIGAGVGEASFVSGRPAGDGTLAPEQARNKISELRSDQNFIQRLAKGEVAAKNEWQRAHEMAFPGDHRIS